MFRRRPRPAPVPMPPSPREGPGQHPELRPPPPPPLEVVEEAIVPIEQAAPPAPPRPFTSWHDAVTGLLEQGYRPLDCPGMCRRKGDHAHLRHEGAVTDVIVSPAAVERSGA